MRHKIDTFTKRGREADSVKNNNKKVSLQNSELLFQIKVFIQDLRTTKSRHVWKDSKTQKKSGEPGDRTPVQSLSQES